MSDHPASGDHDFPAPGHPLPPVDSGSSAEGVTSSRRYGQSPVSGGHVVTPSRDVDDEISLLDILIVLAKHKKLILGLPLVAAILAAGISLLLPNWYTATTKILPTARPIIRGRDARATRRVGGRRGAGAWHQEP